MKKNEDLSQNADRVFVIYDSYGDFILGAITLIWGLLLKLIIIPSQVQLVGKTYPTTQSFPNFLAYSFILLSFPLFYTGYKKQKKERKVAYTFDVDGLIKSGCTLGTMILSVFLMKYIPYIPVAAGMLAILMLLCGQRNVIYIIGVSIILPILIYFGFTNGLRLVLP